MAFKIAKYCWRSMSENVNVINGLFRSSVSSASKVPDLIAHHVQHQERTMKGGARRGKLFELLPFMGLVFGVVGMGIHTAYHQLRFWRSFFGMRSGNKQYYSKNTMQGAKSWTNIYMVGGLVLLGMGVGISTGSRHLIHSPGCLVSKKKRLSFPELELSGDVMHSGKKYGICQKLCRFNHTIGGRSNASSPNPYQQI